MKGFYDRGRFDVDTYEVSVPVPRSAIDLKSDMAQVTTELGVLPSEPNVSTDFLVAAIEQVRDNGTLSTAIVEPSGSVRTWGFRDGRQMVMDVIVSARSLLAEVRELHTVKDARTWFRVKRSLHPGWFSFYHSSQTD